MSVRRILARGALSIAGTALCATLAHAQIETVVVTAQKRAQDVQAVPIAVDAFSGDTLKQANVSTVNDLQTISPSLVVYTTTSGASDTTFKIRGVGTTGNNPGLEGAVGTFVDGVYRNRSGLALGDLIDVERIEVLEGPQSTLFGKNTSAGALNIITRSPDDSHSGYVQAGMGNYGQYKLAGWLNVPISDTLFSRWDAVYSKRDGFIKNPNGGPANNDRDRYYLKGQLLWQPNDDVSLRTIVDFSHGTEHCCGAIRILNGATAPIINALEGINGSKLTTASRTNLSEPLNAPDTVNFQDQGISAELNWQFNKAVKLTNIMAYRAFSQDGANDTDYTGASILTIPNAGFKDYVFSEEFRLTGHSDFQSGLLKSMDWLAGIYYTNETIRVHSGLTNGAQAGNYWCAVFLAGATPCFTGSAATSTLPVVPTALGMMDFNRFLPGTGDVSRFNQDGDSWSGFAQTTMNFTDKFSMTGGLRYSSDTKKMFSHISNNNPTQAGAVPGSFVSGGYYTFPFWIGKVWDFPTTRTKTSTAVTGTIKAQYFWTDAMMGYVSYSRGYKSGGFNLDRTAGGLIAFNPTATEPYYKPERSDSWEAGVKTQWWDNRLLLNGTIFYEKFHDLQVLNFDGTNFHIFNEPTGTSKGFEVKAELAPVRGLTLNSSVTYADTNYGTGSMLQLTNAITGAPDAPAILTGNRFTNAPLWSTTEGITYSFPIGNGSLVGTVHGDMFYGSSRNTGSDLAPEKRQDGYSLFNARLSLAGGDNQHWDLSVWCRNCTNKHYLSVVFDSVGQPGSYDSFIGDPQTYGVTASMKF
jgi:outer membrane receptor protein involved in Fe transport